MTTNNYQTNQANQANQANISDKDMPFRDTDAIERIRRELAVGLYGQGVLWLDEASKLACMHFRDFQHLLQQQGVALRTEDVSMIEYLWYS